MSGPGDGHDRILMVTPYPPLRDGIANYAAQEVKALRGAGHDVEVLSPGPSAAHHHLDLRGPRGPLALARRVRDYDRVIVQFHPDVFFPPGAGPALRAATMAGLVAAFAAARHVEVRVHEVDYSWGRARPPMAALARSLWRRVDRITVHTEPERTAFEAAFGLAAGTVELVGHGANFERRTALDRPAARRALGVGADELVFVSIGFLQPHKGFDRAIRAFGDLGRHGCRLDVVGSVRVTEPDYVAHRDELARLAAATPGVRLHEGYVSDETFDRWLVAADVVVLPYRHIWSSSVLERAATFDRRVIATDVGGLADQAGEGVELVADDAGLARAMAAAAEAAGVNVPSASRRPGADTSPAGALRDGGDLLGVHGRGVRVAEPWPVAVAGERGPDPVVLQAEVRRRAAARRRDDAPPPAGGGTEALPSRGDGGRLARLPAFSLPEPVSSRPLGRVAKKVVHRGAYWLVAPLVRQLNEARAALLDDLRALGAQEGHGSGGPGDDGDGRGRSEHRSS